MLSDTYRNSTELDSSYRLNSFQPLHWIAIIGVGAGGASYFRQALKKVIADGVASSVGFLLLDVKSIEEQGKGIAWALNQAPFISANMHLPKIGYDPSDPNRLLELLGLQDNNFSQDASFLSRSEVGKAFSKDLNIHVEIAERAGIPVNRIQGEAARVDRLGRGYAITLSSGEKLFADTVILGLGHIPSTNYKELEGSPMYIGNPWDARSLDAIPSDANVAILGLGPTAVDTINILRANGVKRIHALSRSGCMQYPRPNYGRYELKVLTREYITEMANEHGGLTFMDILRGIGAEYRQAGIDCSGLKRAIANARQRPEKAIPLGLADCQDSSEWFSVFKALDDVTPLIWHLLPEQERTRYKREYRQAHVNVSYGSASKPAKKILEALHDGSLRVSGGLEEGSVHFAHGKYQVSWLADGMRRQTGFDCVINCSGIGTDLTKARYPLLGYLLGKGWLVPHPEGGALVDFESGQLLTRERKPVGEIYSLVGSITYGTHLLTHCMDQVVNSARRTSEAVHVKILEIAAPDKL
ncbi:FAD/NAD(P)-binding protein [Bradyrhizobium sp. sGM-13]|uniref:FAD/NAD(P)-binding protein n=1 Tax=Bradyrhizobium sp. sGM-13 TaxID=2831781 RepID=UPI001BCFD3B7|nr:FAD/NAD(P)-binding protein [Bradyrhizobium sp. sGM-13]